MTNTTIAQERTTDAQPSDDFAGDSFYKPSGGWPCGLRGFLTGEFGARVRLVAERRAA